MNYSKQIFEMIGVKPNEEFELSNGLHYCLDEDLELWYRNPEWIEGRFESADYSVKDILNDTFQIIKLPKKITPTKEEQAAIDYAKACGCKWIYKEPNGNVYATDKKPKKKYNFWRPVIEYDTKNIQIEIPMSFISWQDQEPYYIGDKGVMQEALEQPDSFF